MKLLVVEDDEFQLEIFRNALEENKCTEQNGCSVVFVSSYEDAVETLKEQYDVVSIDGSFLKNGRTDGNAGLMLIDNLENCNHAGFTIFYSANADQISLASTKNVAGRSVLSYLKTFGLPSYGWAELCIRLAEQNKVRS